MAVLGCGSSGAPADAMSTDAPSRDGGDATAPSIPWLADGAPPLDAPELVPCPDGWREVVSATGPTTCEPYPEAGPSDCADGQAHFPGEPGCADVGSPCPLGDFSTSLPTDRRVVYVQPGTLGGDGSSPSSPYATVTEFSIGGLPAGTVIALSRGTHVGPVRLARSVVLRGACAAQTVLTTTEPSTTEGVVTMRGAGGEVFDLTVESSPRGGVRITGAGARGILDGVVISGTELSAVFATDDAHLSAATVVVRDTRGRSDDLRFGRGFTVQDGATVELARALVERNRESAIAVLGGEVSTSDAVVRDTDSEASSGTSGRGLSVQAGGVAHLTSTLVERNRDVGVFGGTVGAAVTLTGAIVRDTRSRARDGMRGRGVGFQDGLTAELRRSVLAGNRDASVFAAISGTAVTMSDVVVRGTGPAAAGGRGIGVWSGATAELTRALVEQVHDAGVIVDGTGTGATLSDIAVLDTESHAADAVSGRGLAVQRGARAVVTRGIFERNRDVAVLAGGTGTVLTLSDVAARDTESREIDGFFGRGLSAQLGATVEVARALFEGNREVGVYSRNANTTLTLSDLAVSDTRPRACAETTCPEAPVGHGLGVFGEATASLRQFDVARSGFCGFLVAEGGQLDATAGMVRDNAIGACLQVDGYDTGRLTTGVRFTDNGTNLQTTNLPVPESGELLLEPP